MLSHGMKIVLVSAALIQKSHILEYKTYLRPTFSKSEVDKLTQYGQTGSIPALTPNLIIAQREGAPFKLQEFTGSCCTCTFSDDSHSNAAILMLLTAHISMETDNKRE